MCEFNANSVEPDQTRRSAASDLGIHCLPMSLLWDARLKWINEPRHVELGMSNQDLRCPIQNHRLSV